MTPTTNVRQAVQLIISTSWYQLVNPGSDACHQELETECDFELRGGFLEVLPRCCPSLQVLRLKQLQFLFDYEYFLPALQQMTVGFAGMHGSGT